MTSTSKSFFRPQADERHYLKVSRLLTVDWGGVFIGVALAAQVFQRSVLELALTVASVPYGCLLGIFLLGVLSRKSSTPGAFLGALAGLGVVGSVMTLTNVAWTWYAVIGTSTTFISG